jgi:endo-1,4-beta-xylanase
MQPITVTNTGTSAITSWTVTFTLPPNHTLVGQWNGVITNSGGTATAKNAPYNGTLAPGASTTFGFQVARPNGDSSTAYGFSCSTP